MPQQTALTSPMTPQAQSPSNNPQNPTTPSPNSTPVSTSSTYEEIRAALAAQQTQQPAQPQVPKEVRLANGQVYRGADDAALIAQLKQAQENAAAEITRLKQLEKEYRQIPPQNSTAQPPTGFKNDEFWSLMDRDPQAGLDYYFSNRFGQSPDEFVSTFQHTTQVASVAEQAMETTAFLNRVPDFPGGDAAASAIMTRLQMRDLPINANNMELVFYELVREGQITPASQSQQTSPTQQPTAAPMEPASSLPTRPLPPPHLTSGGAASPQDTELDLARRAAGLSTSDLEKLLRETGIKKF